MQLLLKNLSQYTGVKAEFNELPTVDISDEWLDIFDLAIPQFAVKERKCNPGNFPCGGRCISGKAKRKDGSAVQCRKRLPGQAKNYAEFLKKQKSSAKKNAGKKPSGSKKKKTDSLDVFSQEPFQPIPIAKKVQKIIDSPTQELASGFFGTVSFFEKDKNILRKDGAIGENESLALKILEKSGIAPQILGAVFDGNPQEGIVGLEDNGTLFFSRAKGTPIVNMVEEDGNGKLFLNAPDPEKILDKVIEARKKMHFLGVAHNDMHPGNVFYDQTNDKVTFVDMGMASIGHKQALMEALGTISGDDIVFGRKFQKLASGSKRMAVLENNLAEVQKEVSKVLKLDEFESSLFSRGGARGGVNRFGKEFANAYERLTEEEAKRMLEIFYKGI